MNNIKIYNYRILIMNIYLLRDVVFIKMLREYLPEIFEIRLLLHLCVFIQFANGSVNSI